jgi:hypothetical protein
MPEISAWEGAVDKVSALQKINIDIRTKRELQHRVVVAYENKIALVRYTRIPDPAHVLSARGWARGEE